MMILLVCMLVIFLIMLAVSYLTFKYRVRKSNINYIFDRELLETHLRYDTLLYELEDIKEYKLP